MSHKYKLSNLKLDEAPVYLGQLLKEYKWFEWKSYITLTLVKSEKYPLENGTNKQSKSLNILCEFLIVFDL